MCTCDAQIETGLLRKMQKKQAMSKFIDVTGEQRPSFISQYNTPVNT